MNRFSFLIFFLFLTQSFGQNSNASPRKNNIISNYIDKTLNSLFDELTKNNLSIPEINLGENVGRIANVEGSILGKLQKHVDGYKSLGFTLDTNVTKILLTGYYDILNLDIPDLFPIYGKGNFRIAVDEINLNMCVSALYNAMDEKMNITILKFKILVPKSTVKFDNLMNDPGITDFLNELISNIIPDLVTMITQPAWKILQNFFDFYGNGIYNCIKKPTPEGIDECIKNLFKTDFLRLFSLKKKVDTIFPELAINLNKALAPKI